MFAVPGWSLGELKTQVDKPETKKSKSGSSNKRKRQLEGGALERSGDRRQPVKERTPLPSQDHGNTKRRKMAADPAPINKESKHEQTHMTTRKEPRAKVQSPTGDIKPDGNMKKPSHPPEFKQGEATMPLQDTKPSKKTEKRRQQRESAQQRESTGPITINTGATAAIESTAVSFTSSKLTPLQTAMRQKLAGARFRHLNETLYTSPSVKALALFDDNPGFFDEYHSGFRQQVSTWPENPVSSYVEDLKRRGKIRWADKNNSTNSGEQPLPRSDGKCTVADLGCGDGALGHQVSSEARRLAVKVLSFDLHSNSPHIIKADVAHLPVIDGSVNVVIFCLALMGINWIDFIEEAWRVLHWKGEVWIAEIKSRFAPPKRRQVEHSVGKRRKKVAAKASDGGNGDTTMGAEVDGAENQESRTDVSAFVDVLSRRGFVLQSEGGIDLRNKMFVKMRFIKSSTPIKGRHAGQVPAQGGSRARAVIAPRNDADELDESTVLKPCLYKIR